MFVSYRVRISGELNLRNAWISAFNKIQMKATNISEVSSRELHDLKLSSLNTFHIMAIIH